jgi:asparagine synthase (glutamine-hydrolysing)
MCGITGIIHTNRQVSFDEIDRFTNMLEHRGPDDKGIFIKDNIAFGHRRLSILDLSPAGRNPLYKKFDDGSEYIITYNGEIFNFIELKNELIKYGYRFDTQTDTEVILAAYHKYGDECLHHFNGMWAFAILNLQTNDIFISRDRFGIKPLYYCTTPSSLYFASEIKAFLAIPEYSFEFDEIEVRKALSNVVNYEGNSHYTIFKNIYKLLPGYNLKIKNGIEASVEKWWFLENNIKETSLSYEEQKNEFKYLLLDAIKIRLRSDVNIGTSLSGGVDSSVIACAINHLFKENSNIQRIPKDLQSVFSITFPGSFLDEKEFIDIVIKEKNIKVKYLSISEPSEFDIIKSTYFSENLTISSLYPILQMYNLMRKNKVTVTLDGHGSDELLCGYSFYLNWQLDNFFPNLIYNFEKGILPAILKNFDITSMASGVEVRMPFLDHRLVSFIFSLHYCSIIGNGYTKRILRESFDDLVPFSIIYRQSKIGINSPLNSWFNTNLNNIVLSFFEDNFSKNNNFFDYKRLYQKFFEKTKLKNWQNNLEDFNQANELWIHLNLFLLNHLYIENNWKKYV